jgi:hypothetical protein
MDPWAAAAGATSLVAAPVYGYVAWRLSKRPVSEAGRLPAAQFSLWWAAVGMGSLVTGVEGLLGAFGRLSLPLAYTAYLLTLVIDSVALWGLVAYLTYIYSGRYHLVKLSAFYAAFYVAALYYTVARHPLGVSEPAGVPTLLYAYPSAGLIFGFVVVGLIVPEVAGAVLYFSLIRKTTDRTLRYRIGLVSAGLFLYFGLAFVAPPASVLLPSAWTLVKAGLAAGAAVLTLIAYFPPARLSARLGVQPVGGSLPTPGEERAVT